MLYEIFYLIGGSRESEVEKIKKGVSEIITGVGGVFEEKETLEKRRLSYKIKHETHGIYIAQRFELEDSQKLSEIGRKINLYPDVLRFIISRTDDLPELKSKEERIAEQEKRAARAASVEKTEKVEPEKVTAAPAQTKKKASEEDIDKKLEEILNI